MADNATLPANLPTYSAAAVFESEAALTALLAQIQEHARAEVFDTSTAAGRKACASLAYKISRSKTYIDEKLGKTLVSELKAKAGAIDEMRRLARSTLDALRDEIRRPVTEWEEAEAERQAALQRRLDALAFVPEDYAGVKAAGVALRIAELEGLEIGEDWQERRADAEQAKAATLYRLTQVRDALQAEEDAAAKAKADAEAKAEAERAAREARIAAEAKAAAEREAEAKAEAEKARAEAELRRVEAEREAAERAKAEAERRAAEADARATANAAEAARVERERIARAAAAEREAEEQRKRNREHAAQVNNAAAAALLTVVDISRAQAESVVIAIVRGEIPNVSIRY
jgi:colicin import membrane protein